MLAFLFNNFARQPEPPKTKRAARKLVKFEPLQIPPPESTSPVKDRTQLLQSTQRDSRVSLLDPSMIPPKTPFAERRDPVFTFKVDEVSPPKRQVQSDIKIVKSPFLSRKKHPKGESSHAEASVVNLPLKVPLIIKHAGSVCL